jgi:hypothetical protein
VSKPSVPKNSNSALVRDTYPALDPQRLPSVNATEEISAADILEALDAVSADDATPSVAPVALSLPTPPVARPRPISAAPPPSSKAPWILGTIALAVLAVLAVLVGRRLYDARVPRTVSSVVVVETGAPNSAAASDQKGIPVVRLDNLPLAPPTRGTLRFPDSAKLHRVFVDGVVVGDGTAPVEVTCGRHAVRVGSRAAPRPIDVPCGGDILVPLH